MTRPAQERIRSAVLDINGHIAEIAREYDLNSNAGLEALYASLIKDHAQALAAWRLRAFRRAEKRRKTMKGAE